MTARVAVLLLLPAFASAAFADGWQELMTKAEELTRKRRFSAAHEMYARAAAAALGTPTPELAQSVTRVASGRLLFEEGRTRDAEQTWRSELAGLESSGLPTLPFVLLHLSQLYIYQQRYAEAEEMLVRCVRRKGAAKDTFAATALSDLGTVYISQARYAEAATALAEARSILRERGDDQGLDAAVIEYKLAGVCSRLGRTAEADDLFELSVGRARQHLGSGDARLLVPMNAFAEHLQRTGRKQRAKELRNAAKTLKGEDADRRQHTVDVRSLRRDGWQ